MLDDLSAALFASLGRADQRARGLDYLRGLLGADGRKSVRAIAAATSADQQGLHHFVAHSTWDWRPVRRALAAYLVPRLPPVALVLRPLVIPKAGHQSVGVTRNAQHALGVWAASDVGAYPLDWRLRLSDEWLTAGARRLASIPSDVVAEPAEAVALAVAAWPEVPRRPVVLDVRGRELPRLDVPYMARVDAAVVPSARRLLASVRGMRRAVGPRLAAAVRVPETDLLLLGVGPMGRPWPAALWLTNLPAARLDGLVRLTTLPALVDRDLAGIGDRVGIRDYTGRSFGGWHRHITLASAAHALTVLTAPGLRRAG
jgi:SRSO17 transposase